MWEAYRRQYQPHLIAVARPHQAVLVGEKTLLDGSRSFSDSRIERFEWTLSDGTKASGPTVERTYSQPGTYSEILKITDGRGRTDYDFETVNVFDPQHPEQTPPSIQAAYWPATGILRGASVTFKVRTFGTTDGLETWSFGDGATARTKSDGHVAPLAKDGFAVKFKTSIPPSAADEADRQIKRGSFGRFLKVKRKSLGVLDPLHYRGSSSRSRTSCSAARERATSRRS